jgi:hypothetical protein
MLIWILKSVLYEVISESEFIIKLFMKLRVITDIYGFSFTIMTIKYINFSYNRLYKSRFSNSILSYNSYALSCMKDNVIDKKERFFSSYKYLFK